jgi:hypothetical protein
MTSKTSSKTSKTSASAAATSKTAAAATSTSTAVDIIVDTDNNKDDDNTDAEMRNTKLFHVDDFDLKNDVRIGNAKPGKYVVVPMENKYTGKTVKIQIDGGGTLPPFAYDTSSQYGTSVVINVEDPAEKKAISKIQNDLATIAIENRDMWLAGSTLSESQIREKSGKMLYYSKSDNGKDFQPTMKFTAGESDLIPQLDKLTKKMNKFPNLKIVDENNAPVALDQLAGRSWTTAIFSLQCIYIPNTGAFNFKKNLHYLAVGEPNAFGTSSKARELLTYDLARDGIIGTKLIPKDRYNLVDLSNKDDGSKIVLRFSNGGKLPPFATDESKFGASNLNFQIDEDEMQALNAMQTVILSHVKKHRSVFLPTFFGDDSAIDRGDMLVPHLFARGKPKKDSPGEFWPHSSKCSFDAADVNGTTNKIIIVDENGVNCTLDSLPRRRYISCDVQFSCAYIQGSKTVGVSKKLVKLVVANADDDEDVEIEPISTVRAAKRQCV